MIFDFFLDFHHKAWLITFWIGISFFILHYLEQSLYGTDE